MKTIKLAALVGLLAVLLTSCGYDVTPLPQTPAAQTPAAPAKPVECSNATQSYAPSKDGGSAVQRIKKRGRLIAGISADTWLMGARNPETNKIEGFDIDVAQRIADALGVTLQLRVINTAERIPLLQEGAIDIVARNFTMNCTRWNDIGFSAEYYHATQKVLVRKDDARSYQGPDSLAKKHVCAPAGSTSVDNIKKIEPDVVPDTATNHTGCLIKFQNGEVDAITGDDTVLAGLAAQDPYAVVPQQAKLTDEPYGIGVSKDDKDLARFINAVLQDMRNDGSWQRSYDKWLRPTLGDGSMPAPSYGRS